MKRLGFRTRLFVVFSLLISIVAAFFAIYFPVKGARAADAALRTRAVGLTSMLANLLAVTVEFDQPKDAENQIASVREDADLRYVVVLKGDGTVFARYRAKEILDQKELVHTTTEIVVDVHDDMLHVYAPMRTGNTQVGTVSIGFSRSSVLAERGSSQRPALLVSLIVIVIGIAAAYF